MASLTVVLISCSKPVPPAAAEKAQQATPAAQPAVGNEPLVLSAAASTKEVMETLSEKFKAKRGREVKVNLGPSSGLAAQLDPDRRSTVGNYLLDVTKESDLPHC